MNVSGSHADFPAGKSIMNGRKVTCFGSGCSRVGNPENKPNVSGGLLLRFNRMLSFKPCTCGFTLVEILVAVFILSIVVATIFVSHSTLDLSARAMTKDLADLEMARICLDRMVSDLRNIHVTLPPAYRPPEVLDETDRFKLVGEQGFCRDQTISSLRFASFAHLPIDGVMWTGITQIAYYATEESDNSCVLRRSDRPFLHVDPMGEKNDPILCERLKSLTFSYVDSNGEKHEKWNSDSEEYGYLTPQAIEVRLTVGDATGSNSLTTMLKLPLIRKEAGKR